MKYKNISVKTKAFLNGKMQQFINGDFTDSKDSATFKTFHPSTGDVICEVAESSEADVEKAALAAKDAFENGVWGKMDASERAKYIYKLGELIERDQQILAEIDSIDNGKPIAELIGNDLPNAYNQFYYYAGWATKNMGQTIPVNGNFLNYTVHEPVGVVGQIIPWNFPLMMIAWKIAPALATGCTVVLKPAEQTPLSAIYFSKLVNEAGFPKGVINIVQGFGHVTGNALVESPHINKIAFTGSTIVGKSIMKKCADTMKRVTLELGGKNPNIILPSADLDKAIPGVFTGIMANQGEVCSAGSKVYVPQERYDEIISGLQEYVKAIKLGDGLDENTSMGPLVSKEQQEKVLNYIESGKEEGAEAFNIIDVPNDGYFVPPTIFTNVNEDMKIVKEEIFGPVVVVIPYDSVESMIDIANSSDFGLAAGIWSENLRESHYVASKLKAGSVWINCYNVTDPASPFGGYKNSGFGREMGSYALENYTEVKSVWVSLD